MTYRCLAGFAALATLYEKNIKRIVGNQDAIRTIKELTREGALKDRGKIAVKKFGLNNYAARKYRGFTPVLG
jgi:hypothetical protein